MKLSVFSVLLATVLIASSNVQSFESNAVNHVRRHHSKAQELQKRETFSGQATWYGWNAGDQGACGEYLQQNDFYVALNHAQYGNMNAQSPYCGKTITITNGIKTTQAQILDACPGDGSTCKWGALDMSQPLFEFFNPLGVGVFQMQWWVTGSGGGGSGSSSGGGGNSNSNNNNDNSNNDDSSDDSNDSDSGSNDAAAKAAAAKQAAAQKAAQEKAAQEKAQQAAAAKKKAAAAAKAKAAKEAAAKKAAAEKKAAAAAAAAAKVKAQHENIAAFGEIMQTLNQIVENAVVPSSGSSSAASSPSSASAASSSKSA